MGCQARIILESDGVAPSARCYPRMHTSVKLRGRWAMGMTRDYRSLPRCNPWLSEP